MPYQIACGHIFCFNCLKSHIRHIDNKCNVCNQLIIDDLESINLDDIMELKKKTSQVIWMYSSNFADHWWTYDESQTYDIEELYQDFLDRTENIKVKEYDESKDLKEKFQIINLYGDIMGEMGGISSLSDSDSEYSDDEEIIPFSYILKIGRKDFRIDFNQMKQISISNSTKRRNIKRIVIKKKKNIEKYLSRKYNVLGISGIKFIDYESQ